MSAMWATQKHPAVLWFAILGALSGVICSFDNDLAGGFYLLDVPVYHGLVFGLAIGIGLFWLGKAPWFAAGLAMITTLVAWIAAFRSFLAITDNAEGIVIIGALVAGAIGSAGTLLGCALFCPGLRTVKAWAVTVLAGAVAGLLVMYPIAHRMEDWFALFIPWQALVAGCIGYFLIRDEAES